MQLDDATKDSGIAVVVSLAIKEKKEEKKKKQAREARRSHLLKTRTRKIKLFGRSFEWRFCITMSYATKK